MIKHNLDKSENPSSVCCWSEQTVAQLLYGRARSEAVGSLLSRAEALDEGGDFFKPSFHLGVYLC